MAASVRRVSNCASDAACTILLQAVQLLAVIIPHSNIVPTVQAAIIILAVQVCVWVDISRQGLPALEEAWLTRMAQNSAADCS